MILAVVHMKEGGCRRENISDCLFVSTTNKMGAGSKQKTFGCNNRLSQTIFKKIVIKSIVEENILLGTSTGVLGFLLVC